MDIWAKIISTAASNVERFATGRVRTVDEMQNQIGELRRQIDQLKDERNTALRHKAEFFDLIERIEKQRDEWREMYKRSAMEQMTALNVVDRALAIERRKLGFVVKRLNEYLEKDGKKLIDEAQLSKESAPPSGEYKRYAESMKALFLSGVPEASGRDPSEPRPADIEGVLERGKLAS